VDLAGVVVVLVLEVRDPDLVAARVQAAEREPGVLAAPEVARVAAPVVQVPAGLADRTCGNPEAVPVRVPALGLVAVLALDLGAVVARVVAEPAQAEERVAVQEAEQVAVQEAPAEREALAEQESVAPEEQALPAVLAALVPNPQPQVAG
jgi:hypothetical protein